MGLALDRLRRPRKRIRSLRNNMGNSSKEETPYRPQFVDKMPPCRGECPNGTNIREVLTTIATTERDGRTYHESFRKAFDIITEKNPFPAVCGRVCPHPCESGCNRQYKDGSLAINNVERFIGDYAIKNNFHLPYKPKKSYSEKIAVIGAGPAGLSAAYQLAIRGYKVTVFEAFQKPGGMLRYGIPDYRLPQDVLDREIERIKNTGVEIRCNTAVGRDISIEDIRREYQSIFIGIGAQKGKPLGMKGEDADNFFTVTEFLNRINSGKAVSVGGKVLVIGGGDAAIDAARICRRLGADVSFVYRRTRKEMPAIKSEVVEAEEENVDFKFLAAPVGFIKQQNKIVRLKCQNMKLGAPDISGRCSPEPIPNDYFELDATAVISAIGQIPDTEGFEKFNTGKGWIKADSAGATKEENVYAGGDALALSLVTKAIYQGRVAAAAMHEKLRGIQGTEEQKNQVANKYSIYFDHYTKSDRHEAMSLPAGERLKCLGKESVSTLTEDQVIDEAKRCMSCGFCLDCGNCWAVCGENIMPLKGMKKGDNDSLKISSCKGCGHCMDECPCGFIELRDPETKKYIRSSMDNSYMS